MNIKDTLRRFVYGEPLSLPVNAHILDLYERANDTNSSIVLETPEELALMRREWGFELRKHGDADMRDSEGRTVLGTFRPDTINAPPKTTLRRIPVVTSLTFIPLPPMLVTHEQMTRVTSLTAASVAWLDDGSLLVYYNGHRVLEVPDGQQNVDESLPINDVNGMRLK